MQFCSALFRQSPGKLQVEDMTFLLLSECGVFSDFQFLLCMLKTLYKEWCSGRYTNVRDVDLLHFFKKNLVPSVSQIKLYRLLEPWTSMTLEYTVCLQCIPSEVFLRLQHRLIVFGGSRGYTNALIFFFYFHYNIYLL